MKGYFNNPAATAESLDAEGWYHTGDLGAFVVTRRPLTAQEVINFVADRVAPYKKIRQVEFIEQLPKSPTGKLLRRVLSERERSQRNLEKR